MNNEKQQPARVLRDRNIKATIWRNQSDKGPWYSVKFTRSYKEGDAYRDTDTFSNGQLLQLSHLAAKAYDAVARMEAQDRDQAAA